MKTEKMILERFNNLQKINDCYFQQMQAQSRLIDLLAKDLKPGELEKLWHEVKGQDRRRVI